MDWDKLTEEKMKSNLKDISSAGFLNYKGMHINFHSVDSCLLEIVNKLMAMDGKFVFLYPVYSFNLSLPICVELLYSKLDFGKYRGKKVLLYSKRDSSFIESYLDTRTNTLSLNNEVFGLGIVKRDGRIMRKKSIVESKRRRNYAYEEISILVTSSEESLPDSKSVFSVIVDCKGMSILELEKLLEWVDKGKVPLVFFFETNPHSRIFQHLLELNYPLWAWSDEMIKKEYCEDKKTIEKNSKAFENPFSSSIHEIKNKAEGFERKPILISNKEYNNLIKKCRSNYQHLKGTSKTDLQRKIARRYLYLICTMEHLLCPAASFAKKPTFYMYNPDPLVQSESLKSLTRVVSDESSDFADGLESSLIDMDRLIEAAMKTTPKAQYILELINEAIRRKKSLAIIAENNPHAEHVKAFLIEKFGENIFSSGDIQIVSSKNLATIRDSSLCVVYGTPYATSRNLIRASLGSRMIFLVYEDESRLLRYQENKDNKLYEKIYCNENRKKFIKMITNRNVDDNEFSAKKMKDLEIVPEKENIEESIQLKDILKDQELAEIEKTQNDITDEYEDIKNGNIDVDAVKITFADGSVIYVSRTRTLRTVDSKNEVRPLQAAELQEGDNVILVNNTVTESLGYNMFKMAEFHPKIQSTTLYYLAWIQILREALKTKYDLQSLLAEMTKRGTDITSEGAIYWWEKELVFQMRNKNNIKIIGEIIQNDYLIKHYDDIYKAMGKLKKIHHKLISSLKKMALSMGHKAEITDEDEIIDEEFDLRLSHFKDTISLKQVESVQDAGKINYNKLNRLMI